MSSNTWRPTFWPGERQFKADRTVNGYTIDQLTEKTRNFSADQQGFNPVDSIISLDIPALWVLGELDESIPTKLTVEMLEDIIARYNKKNFTIEVIPNANHAMMNPITGEKISWGSGLIKWMQDVAGKH
jgi:pimeloyl-ACP methyl ester carboxylesterase